MALMQYRLKVEIEYLIALSNEKKIHELPMFSNRQLMNLRTIYENFDINDAKKIKSIEKRTNHDVKAIEYFINSKLKKSIHPWVHFALTSEDVNNLAYSLMWGDAIANTYLPELIKLNKQLRTISKRFKKVPMLALTHGQPATPTTFGKEIAVYYTRIKRQITQIKSHQLMGKLGGATGTWSAHFISYPKINWLRFSEKFIKHIGLKPNLITTQIEPHDSIVENYMQLSRVNNILIDFCQDIWIYISRGIIAQKRISEEVGSSAMPHKINPIQFENAEGNMQIANALLNHLSMKLSISRMQRDLTDSTTIRNQGVAMGHAYLGVVSILKGLKRIDINKTQLSAELDNHWEVLAEAVQTILRKAGQPDAYEKLKTITRGKAVDVESVAEFVYKLNLSEQDTQTLLTLTPANYIGLAPKLSELI